MAKLLLKARQGSGLTQRQVAARLHKPASYPHKVEHGEREINIVELVNYCEALQIDFAEFATEIALRLKELRRSQEDQASS